MKRILTASVLIPIIVWTALAAPETVFLAVLVIVGALAFHEFDTIAGGHGYPRSGFVGIAAGLVFLLAPEPVFPVLLIVALGLMTWMLRAPDLGKVLAGAAVALLGIVYIFGAWRSAVLLRAVNPHWLMIALLVSWVGDTFALYVGRSLGKRKLAPRVSPNKTWEGTIGSVGGGVLAAVVYAHYLIPAASPAIVAFVAVCTNAAGQVGDLCESAFKRGAGMKDSGTLLPGHGGWLDRIDSSLFAIPVTYAVLSWL